MERHADPYSLAAEEIRRRVRSGKLVQGEQLRVSELSDDLRLSGSPVREALSRLAGEGLIEDRRGAGYFAWRLDAVDLAELYALQAALLWSALEASAARDDELAQAVDPMTPFAAQSPLEATEAGLLALVRGARSHVLVQAHLRVADRLAPARRVEPLVISDLAGEWLDLMVILSTRADVAARAWVVAYQRRREANAAGLVAALRAAADGRRRI